MACPPPSDAYVSYQSLQQAPHCSPDLSSQQGAISLMNSCDALLDGQWSVFPWTDTEGRKANRVLGQNYKQMFLSVLHEYKLVLFLFSDGNGKERIHQQ